MKWFGSSERNPIVPEYAKRLRVPLAFVISPLVPALLGVALAAFARGDPGIIFSTATLWAVKIGIAFGYPVALAIGVPLYLVLRKYRLTDIWIFVLAGGGCGVVMYLLFIILPLMVEGAAAMMRRRRDDFPSELDVFHWRVVGPILLAGGSPRPNVSWRRRPWRRSTRSTSSAALELHRHHAPLGAA